jgi:hypothetical protein
VAYTFYSFFCYPKVHENRWAPMGNLHMTLPDPNASACYMKPDNVDIRRNFATALRMLDTRQCRTTVWGLIGSQHEFWRVARLVALYAKISSTSLVPTPAKHLVCQTCRLQFEIRDRTYAFVAMLLEWQRAELKYSICLPTLVKRMAT